MNSVLHNLITYSVYRTCDSHQKLQQQKRGGLYICFFNIYILAHNYFVSAQFRSFQLEIIYHLYSSSKIGNINPLLNLESLQANPILHFYFLKGAAKNCCQALNRKTILSFDLKIQSET